MQALDPGTLITVASLVAGFSTSILVFRLQREIEMHSAGEITWLPWADRLILLAAILSLASVLLIVSGLFPSDAIKLASCALAASLILTIGYVLAVLAHYRFILSFGRSGPRKNPEPAERVIVLLCLAATIATVILMFFYTGAAAA